MTYQNSVASGQNEEIQAKRLARIQYEAYLAQLDQIGKEIDTINDHPEWDDDEAVIARYNQLKRDYTTVAEMLKRYMDANGISGSELVITQHHS